VAAAIQFVDLDEATRRVLADKMFGDAAPWEDSYQFKPGVASSLRSLCHAITVPWRSFSWERRRMLRIRSGTPCRLNTSAHLVTGTLRDMSFTGVSASFASTPKGKLAGSLLELPHITLKVSPVSIVRRFRETCVRFRVDSVERGQQRWRELHDHRWKPS
jgi:hypothetical protein